MSAVTLENGNRVSDLVTRKKKDGLSFEGPLAKLPAQEEPHGSGTNNSCPVISCRWFGRVVRHIPQILAYKADEGASARAPGSIPARLAGCLHLK